MSSKTIPIAYSIALYRVTEKLLFVGDTENSDTKPEERDLPFNVKYKLQRNQDMLLKDYAFYESERTSLIKKLGVKKDDRLVVPEDKIEEYREELFKTIQIEVEHSFKTLTPEEVDSIKGDIKVTCEEMNLFIAYMVEDSDLVNDLGSDIKPSQDKDTEDAENDAEDAV